MSLDGVKQVDVSLLTEDATVIHDETITPAALAEAVEDIGFDAKVQKANELSTPSLVTHIGVGGMTCSACVNSVTNALSSVPGVSNVDVSLLTEEATITHSEDVKPSQLVVAVEDCGFDATLRETVPSSSLSSSSTFSESYIESVVLRIYGMTCTSCSNSIMTQVSSLTGVSSCSVALATEEAHVTFDSSIVGIRTIIGTIQDCGFDATVAKNFDTVTQIDLLAKVKDIKYWRTNFLKILLFGLPVIFLEHVFPRMMHQWQVDGWVFYADILVQLLLGTYIQVWLGRRFYINAYKALKHYSGTMDTLICTSTSIVYAYSVCSIFRALISSDTEPPTILFDTSSMLFGFVSLGKWAESKAKGNTSTALSKLLQLAPSSCVIIENPGDFEQEKVEMKEETAKPTSVSSSPSLPSSFNSSSFNSSSLPGISQKEIPAELLQRGDIAVVLPGAAVPSDGTCIFGSSEVDESLLTGESLPVAKSVGSKLIGGSVNAFSTLYMRVDRVGETTQLQQIVKLVKDAQVGKAPVQRFADAIAAKFVPTVLTLSVFTFLFWSLYIHFHSGESIPSMFKDRSGNVLLSKVLQISISVIVVACPCALGLAAPTAVMVGTGVGATNGILIKGGEILERASGISTIVFDKTGTITAGRMKVSRDWFASKYRGKEYFIWSLLYTVEQNSEHQVAKAIVARAAEVLAQGSSNTSSVFIQDVETKSGLGIAANVLLDDQELHHVLAGNVKYISDSKISNLSDFNEALASLGSDHVGSVCHLLLDDTYCGFVELEDSVRSDSASTVRALQRNGYSVAMVTGDNARTARHVACKVGIPLSNVLAEARPQDKLHFVELLQQKGLKVAFVGDGINDAPALVQADVGIAVALGTDVAISAADIVLMSSEKGEGRAKEDSANSSMSSVFNALEISLKSFHVIRTNFILAIIYNLMMLPVAMGLFLVPFGIHMHPMLASASMACSSVSVVLNSLLLKWWKPCDIVKKYSEVAEVAEVEESELDTSDLTDISADRFVPIQRYSGSSFLARLKRAFGIQRSSPSESYEMVPAA
ncbi:DEKNAAC100128 [Brettanomyces naardenensis]|uniref:DEKNAAC100128 n=1 Tax=Brettanomyces naardenensis TaxID=13370 RepID=A0A448YEK9_BRENA|nr:DEKNAAC100128 [Brettanomyces naardenensis]